MKNDGNLFDNVPGSLREEQIIEILSLPGATIERIVSTGQTSPQEFWYDQDLTEWVLVLSGAARIQMEGEEEPRQLTTGDYLCIPPHKKHRVVWTDPERPTIWLVIHLDPGPRAILVPKAP